MVENGLKLVKSKRLDARALKFLIIYKRIQINFVFNFIITGTQITFI